MKKAAKSLLMILMVLSLASVSYAGKSADAQGVYIGNGFPSGPHYNLNVIAKKAGFVCPAQQYMCSDGTPAGEGCTVCESAGLSCQPAYGGVIFVPQEPGNTPINILMESGAKGPRGNPEATSLEVTDWCTETFDGSGASFRLPANALGYAVYARIVGDPKQNPQFDFTTPTLKYVIDEGGNPLLLLGFVSNNTVYGSEGQVLSRYDSNQKGRKVQNATNITPFFKFQGGVCYISPDNVATYCPEEQNCIRQQYCCLDSDNDGIYEFCDFAANLGVPTGEVNADGTSIYACPTTVSNWCCVDVDSGLLYEDKCTATSAQACTDGIFRTGAVSQQVDAVCRQYDTEWIFNIADFVGFMFGIANDSANSGSSVLQVRFYPLH